MTALIKPLALGLAALLLQTTSPSPSPTTPAKTTTFHNDAPQFDYVYDSSLVANEQVSSEAMQEQQNNSAGATKAVMSCLALPLTAMDVTAGFRMLLIMRMDTKCMGQTIKPEDLPQLTTAAFSQSLRQMGGEPVIGTASPYTVAGNNAAVISGLVDIKKAGYIFHGIASCAIVNGDVVCWELISTTCSSLQAMMEYPVKFKGQDPTVLIPAKYAPECKA